MNDTTYDHIAEMIAEHFTYIEWDVEMLDEQAFEAEYGDEIQARHGWTLPDYGAFCVERIHRQTVHLNAQDLEDYLRAMFWMCDRHIVLAAERPDLGELDRHHAIESELYDIAPDSMTLMSEVELKALDDA